VLGFVTEGPDWGTKSDSPTEIGRLGGKGKLSGKKKKKHYPQRLGGGLKNNNGG